MPQNLVRITLTIADRAARVEVDLSGHLGTSDLPFLSLKTLSEGGLEPSLRKFLPVADVGLLGADGGFKGQS